MNTPFYITTAISYPNGRPHIGHAYEAIATDAIARFHRLNGRDVRLITGTDEHGLKMAQTARDAGRNTLEFATEMSSYFRDMCTALNIEYNQFMRTTSAEHHHASQTLWQAMADRGDLYLDRYEGWYSVRDEAFYGEEELTQGEGGQKLSPQGTPVTWTVEESWFFRLSAYQDRLLAHFRDNPDFIQPESRRNEVLRFVEAGLRDLSVSRTSFDWGVPVPGSDGHVMYVWVDALTTYLSGIGYPDAASDFGRFWPANVHIIGKDIVRFHAVYWPAFLMSAGLPLPQKIFGHGFILARDGAKMGKSAGNAADPLALADRYGVDQFRYFLLREVAFGQDGTYSEEAIVARCNADLANSFGNLAQRVFSFIAKNCDGKLAPSDFVTQQDAELTSVVAMACAEDLPRAFEELALSQGLEAWMRAVFACNQYVDEQAPWALRKTDPQRMNDVLVTLYGAIRDLAIAIAPVTPAASATILDIMDIPGNERDFHALRMIDPRHADMRVVEPKPVFPRLDMPSEVSA
jgi:methionyl-tRNA synthetase